MGSAATYLPLGTRGQLWRYGAVGTMNTLLGLSVILALHLGAGLDVTLSNALGYAVGLSVSYALNGSWTFRFRGRHGGAVLRFLLVVVAAFAASQAVLKGATGVGSGYAAAQLAAVASYSILLFLGMKYLVYVDRR